MKPKNSLQVAEIFFLLVLVTTILAFRARTFYIAYSRAEDGAKVASFVFNANDVSGHVINLQNIEKPGDSETVVFDVSTAGTEVAESYVIKIAIDGSMPLSCVIKDSDENTVISAQLIDNSSDVPTESESSVIYVPVGSADSRYTLTAVWPEEQNDVQLYASGRVAAEVTVTVTGRQVN